ncbi:protein transport protein bet1 [Vanrija albida]|uniref:Protein transport protein bet1 n=1 Tax=Vanrija albida TaxID=181172 RepID=A0ABR3QD38_9TREE
MSGLSRVNRRLDADRPNGTPSPVLLPPSGGPSSGRASPGGPGSGFAAQPYGAGPGSGFAPPSGGRASPFPRPGSGASAYSESPFGGGMSSGGAGYTRTAYELEQHNDDRLGGLLGKVDILKNLTVGIGNEVRDGNLELAGMNDTFGSTGNLLSGTWKRMTKMAKRQGSNWCWFMGFLFIVLWIFVIVWFLRR